MRKRNISIPIRVTEKELNAIDSKSARAGMSRTDYLVACAVGKRIAVIDGLTPLLAELRRIGNNLNQVTKLAHLGKIGAYFYQFIRHEYLIIKYKIASRTAKEPKYSKQDKV